MRVKASAVRRRPRGREEVRAAVLAAAERLFAERGYAAVSVRDLAQAAGVNHGLIHRHFGSKERVLHDVLYGVFADIAATAATQGLDEGDPDFVVRFYALAARRKRHFQIMMRAVLDGYDFATGDFQFPLTRAVLRHVVKRRGADDPQARAAAAAIVSAGLGWMLLQDYLRPILDLQEMDDPELQERVLGLVATLGGTSRSDP